MAHSFSVHGKTVSVFPGTAPDAPAVYLNTFAGEIPQIVAQLHGQELPDFSLVAVSDLDWNHDMVPWDQPPVFKNAVPCTGGADDYLRLLTETILPLAEKELAGVPRWRGLAGYSLAGLFALYAMYRTDVFSRFASMSGSLWFPGFPEYIRTHGLPRLPDCIYFSLGDKESKTRNPVLKNVRDNTEAIQAYYQHLGIRSVFRLYPGNHYNHAVQRTADGIAWLLEQPSASCGVTRLSQTDSQRPTASP